MRESQSAFETPPGAASVPGAANGNRGILAWLERIDHGARRRIKGLRLVAAYGIAAATGALLQHWYGFPGGASLSYVAAGFALWASVSEAQTTRLLSIRDFVFLNAAAAGGAAMLIGLAPILGAHGGPGIELVLVTGAFLVGYLKGFGILGAGIGSQIYIGQLLAYSTGLSRPDLKMVAVAGLIAAAASIIPRLFCESAEHAAVGSIAESCADNYSQASRGLRMGLQAAVGALAIVLINRMVGMLESAWAITACTYVIAGSAAGSVDRVRRRIIGTLIGVPLGIACLPIAKHAPPLAWMMAAAAMIIYAMALPERYDIACAAYAFTLMVTLAVSGENSVQVLAARAWETLIGGALGVTTAKLVLPLRTASHPMPDGPQSPRSAISSQ